MLPLLDFFLFFFNAAIPIMPEQWLKNAGTFICVW